MSPMSEAKKRANKKWNDANMKEKYDRIQLVLPKGMKGGIQSAAVAAGESVNAYIYRAIMKQMQDGPGVPAVSPAVEDGAGGGFSFSAGSPAENVCSRFVSQWGPDFQTALADSGQSAEEYLTQAVRERMEREKSPETEPKPLEPQAGGDRNGGRA